MLKKSRTLLASIVFALITLLFLDITGVLHHWLGWLARIQALEAVLALNVLVIALLVVLTLVFGRIYCSVICPLGIMQDLLARFRRKKNKYSYSPEVRWLRYLVLGVFLVALVAGVGSIFQLLAPYSAFGRIATMLFQPIWACGNNLLARISEHYDSYAFYSVDVWMKSLPVFIVALATLLLLAVLAWRGGRTYCNTICPVGTALSFLARFSWLKVHFDTEKCTNCSLCSKNCKASCIDYTTHTVDYSRCVVCGNCLEKCKFNALTYGRPMKPARQAAAESHAAQDASAPQTPSAPTRRSFLLSAALLSGAAMAQDKKKVDGGLAVIEAKALPVRQTPLTPPGSLSARNIQQHCTGCQLCVSECPNHVLRPSGGLMNLMQPVMSYERGYCRPECTRCSDVCPAGAIRPLDSIEKSSIQIGHAVWIEKNCLPVAEGVDCGNCAAHCPAGAIEMMALNEDDDLSPIVPIINESACIGCGACEYVCPARPFSAIFVEGHEVHKTI